MNIYVEIMLGCFLGTWIAFTGILIYEYRWLRSYADDLEKIVFPNAKKTRKSRK